MPSLLRPAVEILAPAGNETCPTATLQFGADAIYFGVDASNLRAHAGNFTTGGIGQAVNTVRVLQTA